MRNMRRGKGKRVLASNIRKCKKRKSDDKIDNTSRRNNVVLRDLIFWLPQISKDDFPENVRDLVKLASTPEEF